MVDWVSDVFDSAISASMGVLLSFVRGLTVFHPIAWGAALLVILVLGSVYWLGLRRMSRRGWLRLGAMLLVVAALCVALMVHAKRYVPPPLSVDGDSRGLGRTQIVPTLDTPVELGKNVICCLCMPEDAAQVPDALLRQ